MGSPRQVPVVSPDEPLVPDRLDVLWRAVEEGTLSEEQFESSYSDLLAGYRETWADALIMDGQPTLRDSLIAELDDE